VQKYFIKELGPAADNGEETFWSNIPAKQKDRGSKKKNNKKQETAKNINSCTQNTLHSEIDIAISVCSVKPKLISHRT